jgi:hypothetical protein
VTASDDRVYVTIAGTVEPRVFPPAELGVYWI